MVPVKKKDFTWAVTWYSGWAESGAGVSSVCQSTGQTSGAQGWSSLQITVSKWGQDTNKLQAISDKESGSSAKSYKLASKTLIKIMEWKDFYLKKRHER